MDLKRVVKGTKEFEDIHAIAVTWWKAWKFPHPALEYLPMNMICAYNEEGPACIGFLYSTDSGIAWLEWIVADPSREKEIRSTAIEMVISSAKILAHALGFSAVFTSSKNQSLNSKLEKKYLKTDEHMTHFIGRV